MTEVTIDTKANPQARTTPQKPILLWALALFGSFFGVMTLRSAYLVLFTTGAFHHAAGNFVPFIVKFNGTAGFFYLLAAFGLFRKARWAVKLSALIATSTFVAYGLFWMHVGGGGLYEMQTVIARPIRFGLWSLIATVSWLTLIKNKPAE